MRDHGDRCDHDGREGRDWAAGTFTDKPAPWELPGSFRLDCEPHRGKFLKGLVLCGEILAPLLIGLPFSLAAATLAWRDLGRMRAGLMDPSGQEQAEQALVGGVLAAACTTLGVAPAWAVFLLILCEMRVL